MATVIDLVLDEPIINSLGVPISVSSALIVALSKRWLSCNINNTEFIDGKCTFYQNLKICEQIFLIEFRCFRIDHNSCFIRIDKIS